MFMQQESQTVWANQKGRSPAAGRPVHQSEPLFEVWAACFVDTLPWHWETPQILLSHDDQQAGGRGGGGVGLVCCDSCVSVLYQHLNLTFKITKRSHCQNINRLSHKQDRKKAKEATVLTYSVNVSLYFVSKWKVLAADALEWNTLDQLHNKGHYSRGWLDQSGS